MKKVLFFLVLLCAISTAKAQVKIGNNPTVINPRSLLELESTNKGLLLPRLSNTEMNVLGTSAPDGMIV